MLTDGPWPGPRPFRSDEWRQFAGRDADLADLLRWIDNGALVIELTGESGIGKTSFLRAGLVPTLTGEVRGTPGDYRVVLCREWPREATTGEELYCRALRRAELPEKGVGFPDGKEPGRFDATTIRSMVATVGRPEQVVIVFDQVEELFRRNRVLAEKFLQTVAEAANTLHVAHILSLRDEYKHELRTLEMLLHPRDQQWMKLLPVLDVEEVIRAPADRMEFPIDPQAVTRLATWWKTARAKQEAGAQAAGNEEEEAAIQALGASRVGLLHLQAVLWSVCEYWKRQGRPRSGITATLARDFRKWARQESNVWGGDEDGTPDRDESALVADAVLRWIQERVSAYEVEGSDDPHLRSEALFAAARIAPHLSSRGYKLPRPAVELAWLAMKQEFDTLQATRRSVGLAVRRMLGDEESSTTSSTIDFPELEGAPPERVAGRIRRSDEPTPRAAAMALVQAFVRGIQLLIDAEIVRQPPVFGGERFYELVHDGYGPPLTYWSELELRAPRYDAQSLVVVRGLDLVHDWLTPDASSLGSEAQSGIGWWSCLIRPRREPMTLIKSLQLEGCDLRGSLFLRCELSGVAFSDTNLLGVVFQDCVFDDVVIDGGLVSGLVVKDSEVRGRGLTLRNIRAGSSSDVSLIRIRGSELTLDRSYVPHVTFLPDGLKRFTVSSSELRRSLLLTSGVEQVTLSESSLRFVEIIGAPDNTTVTAEHGWFVHTQSTVPVKGTDGAEGLELIDASVYGF